MEEIANANNISEDLAGQYDTIIEALQEAKNDNLPLDEGIVKAIIGGTIGALAGPSIMKAVANVLGLKENGTLYNTMTSRLVTTAVAAYLGLKN